MTRHPLPLALAAVWLLTGCARDAGPEASYRAFAAAVAERDGDAAYALLSAGSQRWLEGQAKRAAAAAPGVVAPSARQLLVGDASLGVRPPESVELVSSAGGRAVLRVVPAGGGSARTVLAVRQGGRWKIELPLADAG